MSERRNSAAFLHSEHFDRQAEMRARAAAGSGFEEREIEAIRDHFDAGAGKQAASARNPRQPMAWRHDHRRNRFIDPLFALPDEMRKIVGRITAGLRACATRALVAGARACVMAAAGERPRIVQRPDDRRIEACDISRSFTLQKPITRGVDRLHDFGTMRRGCRRQHRSCLRLGDLAIKVHRQPTNVLSS